MVVKYTSVGEEPRKPTRQGRRWVWSLSYLGKVLMACYWAAIGLVAWVYAVPGWTWPGLDYHDYTTWACWLGGVFLVYDVVLGFAFVYYDTHYARVTPRFFYVKSMVMAYELTYALAYLAVILPFLLAYDDRACHFFDRKEYEKSDPEGFLRQIEFLTTNWAVTFASLTSFSVSTLALVHYSALFM